MSITFIISQEMTDVSRNSASIVISTNIYCCFLTTPQLLYNTIVGVHSINRDS